MTCLMLRLNAVEQLVVSVKLQTQYLVYTQYDMVI